MWTECAQLKGKSIKNIHVSWITKLFSVRILKVSKWAHQHEFSFVNKINTTIETDILNASSYVSIKIEVPHFCFISLHLYTASGTRICCSIKNDSNNILYQNYAKTELNPEWAIWVFVVQYFENLMEFWNNAQKAKNKERISLWII